MPGVHSDLRHGERIDFMDLAVLEAGIQELALSRVDTVVGEVGYAESRRTIAPSVRFSDGVEQSGVLRAADGRAVGGEEAGGGRCSTRWSTRWRRERTSLRRRRQGNLLSTPPRW